MMFHTVYNYIIIEFYKDDIEWICVTNCSAEYTIRHILKDRVRYIEYHNIYLLSVLKLNKKYGYYWLILIRIYEIISIYT